jgi:cysteine desulfurase
MAPGVRIHGFTVPRLPNTTNAAFPGVSGETLVIALDLAGFAVSTGSACASGAVMPSHVMRAMGFDDAEARGAVRFSLGWNTTSAAIDRLIAALPPLLVRATMSGR